MSTDDRYYEDFAVGARFDLTPILVEEGEVVAFAQRYDPQAMHVDKQAAEAGPFGGLIASGWHTVSLLMRRYVQDFLPAGAALASPGVDELRWLKPVRPGDTLRGRVAVLDKRVSRSKPDRGLLITHLEGFNQHGECVVSFKPINLVRLRG